MRTHTTTGRLLRAALPLALGASMATSAVAQTGDWYVDSQNATPGNGMSWSSAFLTIDQALNMAQADDEIWVKATPGVPNIVPGTGARSDTFFIGDGVHLRGGFNGTETQLSQRPSNLFQDTILSGDIGMNSPAVRAEDAYHVVTIESDDVILDGFRIQFGNANGSGQDDSGGGIYADSGFRTGIELHNLTVTNCVATSTGAGIHARLLADSVFTRLTVSRNLCFAPGFVGDGGGMYLRQCFDLSIFNSHFVGNRAVRGAGVFNDSPDPEFSGSAVEFQNCLWHDNFALSGAAYYGLNPNGGSLSHCTMANNSTTIVGPAEGGAGIRMSGTAFSPLRVQSSIVYSNTSVYTGPIYAIDSISSTPARIQLTHTCVDVDPIGWTPAGPVYPGWFGVGCFTNAPQFTNQAGRIYTLQGSSPCLDAGDDTDLIADEGDLDGDMNLGETTPLDLANNPREFNDPAPNVGIDAGQVVAAIADMGAYERQTLPTNDPPVQVP